MEIFDVLKARAGIPVDDTMAVLFAQRKKYIKLLNLDTTGYQAGSETCANLGTLQGDFDVVLTRGGTLSDCVYPVANGLHVSEDAYISYAIDFMTYSKWIYNIAFSDFSPGRSNAYASRILNNGMPNLEIYYDRVNDCISAAFNPDSAYIPIVMDVRATIDGNAVRVPTFNASYLASGMHNLSFERNKNDMYFVADGIRMAKYPFSQIKSESTYTSKLGMGNMDGWAYGVCPTMVIQSLTFLGQA